VKGAFIRFSIHASCAPTILRGGCPPVPAGAQLPVARKRCDHFTTLDGATSSAADTCRTLSPRARRAIARSRKSIDIALPTSQPSILGTETVNQQNTQSGIPKAIQTEIISL